MSAWSTENGLPGNSVSALAQTPDGYIWVGTAAGLARFDGVRFKVFNPANCPALPSSQIMGLFPVGTNTLLVSTERGGLVALQAGRFTRLRESGFENDYITACLPLSDTEWLLASYSGPLYRWREGQLETISSRSNLGAILERDLVRDRQGRIWMLANRNRVLRLEGNRLEEVVMKANLLGAEQTRLALDRDGQLWLATAKGLARWATDHFELVDATGVSSESAVEGLIASRDGGLWMQSATLQIQYRSATQVGPVISLPEVKTAVVILGEDRWGRLLLGGHHPEGLFLVAKDGRVTHLTQRNGLSGNMVICYLADREGNEWLGLKDGGLMRLRPRMFQLLPGFSPEASVPAESVCETHDGAVWVGTDLGGLYKYFKGEATHYAAGDLPVTHLNSIFEDHRSNVWLGTSWYGAFQLQSNRFVEVYPRSEFPGRINVIYEDAGQVLWFGCGSGLVSRQNGRLQKQSLGDPVRRHSIRTITSDQQGRLWIGTGEEGLWCRQNGQWTPVLTNSFARHPIWSLYADRENTLWIGTQGGGLGRLRDGKLVALTTRNGLWDDTVTHIAEDGHGQFWLGSPRGVFRIGRCDLEGFAAGRLREVACIHYGPLDGMPSAECQGGFQPAGCTLRDGRLLFPTLKGVAMLDPEAVTVNELRPPVLIEEALVDGEEKGIDPADHALTVPPGKSRLLIHFTALSYSGPQKVRFKCRLLGLEENWVNLGARRSADYSYLQPGQYVFEVQACNNDGLWNPEIARLKIKILPYYWQTGWFLGLLLAGGAVLIALAARGIERQRTRFKIQRLQHEQAVERERARIAQDIHDDLGASLTRMVLLSELLKADKQSPEAVEEHAQRIGVSADGAVKSLDAIVWAVNPRNDTLESLLQYLSHFAYDFFQSTAIQCQLDIPAEVPPIPIEAETRHNLFLAVKEALNNALKHSGATEVSLQVTLQKSELRIRIADNGRGFTPSDAAAKPARNGLGNMKQRLSAIGGSLQTDSQAGQGTVVTIQLHLYAGAESRKRWHTDRDATGN